MWGWGQTGAIGGTLHSVWPCDHGRGCRRTLQLCQRAPGRGLKVRAPCRWAEISRLLGLFPPPPMISPRVSQGSEHGPQPRARSLCILLRDSPAAHGPGRCVFPGFAFPRNRVESPQVNAERVLFSSHSLRCTQRSFGSTKPRRSPCPPPISLPIARGHQHPALPRALPRRK